MNWNTFWGFPISFYYQIYIWTREERFKFLGWYASKEYLFVVFFVTLNIFSLNLNNNVLFDDFEIHVQWCWLTSASIASDIELLNKIRYGHAKKKRKKKRGHQIFMAFSYVQICVKKYIRTSNFKTRKEGILPRNKITITIKIFF